MCLRVRDIDKSVFVEEKSDEESNNDIDYCNKISKDGYYKPEEIVLMPIPGSGSKEFLFCVKMYCENSIDCTSRC